MRSSLLPPCVAKGPCQSEATRCSRMTHVAGDEFGQVDIPYFERYGEAKQLDSTLVDLYDENVSSMTSGDLACTCLEALLEVLVVLQELGIVDNDLSVGDLEINDLVIDSLGAVDGSDGLLEVDVKGPQL